MNPSDFTSPSWPGPPSTFLCPIPGHHLEKNDDLCGKEGFLFVLYGRTPCWMSLVVQLAVRFSKQTGPAAFLSSSGARHVLETARRRMMALWLTITTKSFVIRRASRHWLHSSEMASTLRSSYKNGIKIRDRVGAHAFCAPWQPLLACAHPAATNQTHGQFYRWERPLTWKGKKHKRQKQTIQKRWNMHNMIFM